MKRRDRGAESGPAVKDRWWVDVGDKKHEPPKTAGGPVGERFYRSAVGFDQEKACTRLTDLNLKLLVESNPPEGGWGYVQLAETSYPALECERIKKLVELPPYARGAVIDCGRSIRLLITGTPIGERILELALGDEPSFDCWVHGEWVREALYDDARKAVAALRRLIEEFLSPRGVAAWESVRGLA